MPENILNIRIKDFPELVKSIGLKSFAANQLIEWLYKERVGSFDEMTNLPIAARNKLKEKYVIGLPLLEKTLEAKDGTKKFLCVTDDGAKIECVLIPVFESRNTVCLSTQVGCACGCEFCRTAKMGFVRNLTQGEILGQLMLIMKATGEKITNIVLMGMGEPLLNVEEVSGAVELMLCDKALAFSKRRITLSTVGLVNELEKFCEKFDVKIAISLNATDDETRRKIMPAAKKYSIEEIMNFCREYSKKCKHRITFEYVMIKNVNDREEDMKRLINLLKGIRAKINLIPFNPFQGSGLKAPDEKMLEKWQEFLYSKGLQATVRISRGQEIMAACGQLVAGTF